MIDFPADPILDEQYVDANNTLWIYNGHNWERTFAEIIYPILALKEIGDVVIGDVTSIGDSYLIYNGVGYDHEPWNYLLPTEPPNFIVYNNDDMTEPAELTPVVIPYNIKVRDSNNKFNTSTYEYEIPVSGYWIIQSRSKFLDLRRRLVIKLYKNGVFYKNIMQEQGAALEHIMNGITLDHFTVGDKLQIYVEGEWYRFNFLTGNLNNEFSGYLVQAD